MKIVYCYILDKSDGGMIHAKEFIRAYIQNGGQIKVIGQDAYHLPDNLNSLGIIKNIFAKIVWAFVNLRFLIRTLFLAIKQQPDVIVIRYAPNHTTLFSQIVLGLFFPILLEVNAVNELEYRELTSRLRIKLDYFAMSKARKIFVVSDPIKKFLITQGYCVENKIAVVENGVDELKFNPESIFEDLRNELNIDAGTLLIGFVGNFKKWHGINNIINAAKLCRESLGDHLFIIVGDGSLKSNYEAKVRDLSLSETVKFIGRVNHDKIPAYLSMMDILLSLHNKQPSDAKIEFHGSPLKIFEYMSMAKPVIAAPLGQIGRVIENRVNGILVDGEDSEKIRDELVKLKRNPKYRSEMGANARATIVGKYTWKINASKVEALCQEITR